ncbi:hypothetical protein TIFTF001_043298, partial [Ficus carica]
MATDMDLQAQGRSRWWRHQRCSAGLGFNSVSKVQSQLNLFGKNVQLQPSLFPLYSEPNWVYCSLSIFPALLSRPCLRSAPESHASPPAPMCWCQWVLQAVPPSHRASTIAAGALVCGHPSSLLAAINLMVLPSPTLVKQMRHRVRCGKRRRTLGRITNYFQ